MAHGSFASKLTPACRALLETWGWTPQDTEFPSVVHAIQPVFALDVAAGGASFNPTFSALGTRAAVAAIYSLVGIRCGANRMRLLSVAGGVTNSAHRSLVALGVADLRTANQATVTPLGLARGGSLTATVLTGTTTVAPIVSMVMMNVSATGSGEEIFLQRAYEGLILQEGEYLWIQNDTVNGQVEGYFVFEELE